MRSTVPGEPIGLLLAPVFRTTGGTEPEAPDEYIRDVASPLGPARSGADIDLARSMALRSNCAPALPARPAPRAM